MSFRNEFKKLYEQVNNTSRMNFNNTSSLISNFNKNKNLKSKRDLILENVFKKMLSESNFLDKFSKSNNLSSLSDTTMADFKHLGENEVSSIIRIIVDIINPTDSLNDVYLQSSYNNRTNPSKLPNDIIPSFETSSTVTQNFEEEDDYSDELDAMVTEIDEIYNNYSNTEDVPWDEVMDIYASNLHDEDIIDISVIEHPYFRVGLILNEIFPIMNRILISDVFKVNLTLMGSFDPDEISCLNIRVKISRDEDFNPLKTNTTAFKMERPLNTNFDIAIKVNTIPNSIRDFMSNDEMDDDLELVYLNFTCKIGDGLFSRTLTSETMVIDTEDS